MDVTEIIQSMSLREKAYMCSGQDFWCTKEYEQYAIPAMMVSDGPHGLRKQDGTADHLGMNESIKAVCFPAGCALASSFDRNLAKCVGETLGNECQAEKIGIILGPAVNIKRSPLCGRNFEYLSEDPYVASEMAAAYIQGVQSKGVGTSIKHFFANNQEKKRMNSSSEISERTAREIYLAAFEGAVKKAKPWSVMCSYNKINGIYSAENRKYLKDVLRDEWGFEGVVLSDWGAVNDIVADLMGGLDLEMPSSNGKGPELLLDAVKKGKLSEETLDRAVEKILRIVEKYQENRNPSAVFNREKDHELSRKISAECMVLLKNEGALPLNEEEEILFVGEFAKRPRYQGGGSSHINSFKVESAWDMAPEKVKFCMGYTTDTTEIQENLIEEAVAEAKKAKKVVVFAGLPDSFESEGYDRKHMYLPQNQNVLISRLAEVNQQVVVVLHNGSPIEMPWVNEVNSILETYLGGEAVGGAAVWVLYGKVNPSGHLAESFPLRLQDTPSYLFYGGGEGKGRISGRSFCRISLL